MVIVVYCRIYFALTSSRQFAPEMYETSLALSIYIYPNPDANIIINVNVGGDGT